MQEIARIKTHFKSLQKPLADLNLGEVVSGVIEEEVGTGAFIVDLANGAKAVVHSKHIAGLFKLTRSIFSNTIFL